MEVGKLNTKLFLQISKPTNRTSKILITLFLIINISYLNPLHVQFDIRHIDSIGDDNVHYVVTDVSAYLQIEHITTYFSLCLLW